MDRRQFVGMFAATGLMFGIKPRTLEYRKPAFKKPGHYSMILAQKSGEFMQHRVGDPSSMDVSLGRSVKVQVHRISCDRGRFILHTQYGQFLVKEYWKSIAIATTQELSKRRQLSDNPNVLLHGSWTLNLTSVPIEGNGFKWFEARVYSSPDHRNEYTAAKSGMFEMIDGGK